MDLDLITNKLEIARKELLDLSFRNPLLNFKLRKASGLEFFNVNISDVYEYLVDDEKTITFTTEDSTKASRLKVLMDEKQLHKRLSQTYRQAKLYLEEKGANTLFLALGFLKWFLDDVEYHAPLILVPVNIKKADSMDRYSLEYSSDDVRFNISLVTKIQNDFSINLEYNDEDFEIMDYFRFIDNSIYQKKEEGWEVLSNYAALDFFSYGKYLMYQDLDVNRWIKDKKLINSEVISGLLLDGFKDRLIDEGNINDLIDPKSFYQVVDADSSQALAIYDVNNGHNLVMQGPPGTGKSQTITNLIANQVALGKTVLFVAEKKAALDVVERRLKSVGLKDLALELHSHKTNRKDVLKSIEDTMNLGEPKISENIELYEKYEHLESDINRYKNAVNKPIANSKLAPINIYGDLLNQKTRLDDENIRIPRVEFENITFWTDGDYERKLGVLREFVDVLNRIDKPFKHPFYGIELDSCMPFEQVSIKERIDELEDALSLLIKAVGDLGGALDTKASTIFDSFRLSNSITKCKDIKINSLNSRSYLFSEHQDFLLDIIQKGKTAKLFYEKNYHLFRKDAFSKNDFINIYEQYENSSLFDSNRKDLKARLQKFMENDKFNQDKLKGLYLFKKTEEYFDLKNDMIREAFDVSYTGIILTDWDDILRETKEIISLHNDINSYLIVPSMKMAIMDPQLMERLTKANENFLSCFQEFKDELNKYIEISRFDSIKRFGYLKWYMDMPLNEMRRLFQDLSINADRIVEIVDYNSVREKMENEGLNPLVELSLVWKGKYDNLIEILKQERLEALINYSFQESLELRDFKKYNHERQIEMFKELDRKIMIENIKFILKKHYEKMPKINDNSPSVNLLRREFQKKRNQMPIRKLLSRAQDAILKIKPVFMMSPLSVASYLEPGEMSFDLVVFDEASQVRPVEAFGALLRAKQIVVVGDSNQLPPTNFFDSLTNKYDPLTDEDYDVANMESILSLLLAKNIPERTLSWHYRSRHKSLIMLSNKEFYNSSLKIFPSVNDLDTNAGLVFRYFPNTIYQRGKTRTNPKEAKEVIKEVFNHAINHPELSLGVVSFSMAQSDEIYKQFENAMKNNQDSRIDEYFKMHQEEPFFIKNLENVQGDERDVIFISIGYGRDENKHLTMDFGPLNKEGGERRLNVLITRARIKTEIFSNITSYDINLARTNAKGVIALKKYLDYAQNRKAFETKNKDSDLCSFLVFLKNKLIDYGYQVDSNVGVKGFGVDLGIVDPKDPNRYLLGIECDGGSYANFDYATDRERIRTSVLGNLGWKIYHLWTTDYYRNPKGEFEKLLNYIVSIQNKEPKINITCKETIDIKRSKTVLQIEDDMVKDYKAYNGPKRRISLLDEIDNLKVLAEKIINVEAPIHVKEVYHRIQQITQVSKLSDKMKKNIASSLSLLPLEQIELRNDFYYIKNKSIIIRKRDNLDIKSKRIDYIPKEEFEEGTFYVLNRGLATTRDEVLTEVANIIGINRSNPKLSPIIDEALNKFIMDNRIYVEGDIYYVNDRKEEE